MTSLVPSTSTRSQLAEACRRYTAAFPDSPADHYLRSRGITSTTSTFFQLGYVADPTLGHEMYRGRLAIPYLTPSGIVSMRFRAVPDEHGNINGPKIVTMAGDLARIYNPGALMAGTPYICIAEGESDTWTAYQCGVPVVGFPGAKSWKPYFKRAFRFYDNVFFLQDNDDKGAGEKLGELIAQQVRNVSIIPMPKGHDVNSYYQEAGREGIRALIGLDQ